MDAEKVQAEALERYIDELLADPGIPAPLSGELDADTVAATRQLVLAETHRLPDAAEEDIARRRVWARVMAADRRAEPTRTGAVRGYGLPWSGRAWRLGSAFAALALVAVASLALYAISRPPAVSAAEIITRARASTNSPAAGGVSSFVLTGTRRTGQDAGETHYWYQSPNRWRSEYAQGGTIRSVQVSDGKDLREYDATTNIVVMNAVDPAMNGRDVLSFFGQDAASLGDLLEQTSRCFDPKVTGSGTVAGRAVYIVDLGPSQCRTATGADIDGRRVLAVDKETFFVLKHVLYDLAGDRIIQSTEVTQVEFNATIDPAQFTFTPPAGAKVSDNRPKPAPTGEQFQRQLRQLAQQAGFPLFAPGYLPAGLAPREPRLDPTVDNLVELSYFPTNIADKESLASRMNGLTIQEQRGANSIVTRWTQGAEVTSIGGNKAWVRRGVRNPDGTGTDSAVLVVRDGVLVTLSSFVIPPEELVKIAASLQPVGR